METLRCVGVLFPATTADPAQKVRTRLLSTGPDMSGTLEHLVKNEGSPGEKKRTATEGLMWLLRGLQFTLAALRRSLDNPDEELSVSFTKAYEATLSKHHSFVVRPVFSVAMKACPYRKDFYAKLGEPADKVVVQLKAWLDALEKILDRMEYLYVYVTLKHGIADAHTDRRTTPRASSSIAPPAPSMLYLPTTHTSIAPWPPVTPRGRISQHMRSWANRVPAGQVHASYYGISPMERASTGTGCGAPTRTFLSATLLEYRRYGCS